MTIKECLDRYLGIPYNHLGRTLIGLDCYGLIIHLYKNLGHELIDFDDYEKDWAQKSSDLFLENYQKQWIRVQKPEPYDVILFKGVKGVASHAGIYLGNGRFLHCIKAGVVVGRLSAGFWESREVEGYFRLKKW